MNGSALTQNINWTQAPAGKLSVIIRHVQPGTTNSFKVSAIDSPAGNASTSNSVSHLVVDNSCGEVWLGWTQTTDNVDPQNAIEYETYVNGVLSPLPVSAGIDSDFVYATAFGDNIFTVKAVDRSGNTSPASSPLKLFLWPC